MENNRCEIESVLWNWCSAHLIRWGMRTRYAENIIVEHRNESDDAYFHTIIFLERRECRGERCFISYIFHGDWSRDFWTEIVGQQEKRNTFMMKNICEEYQSHWKLSRDVLLDGNYVKTGKSMTKTLRSNSLLTLLPVVGYGRVQAGLYYILSGTWIRNFT